MPINDQRIQPKDFNIIYFMYFTYKLFIKAYIVRYHYISPID
ncbi:MAG: hypothetical protein HSCHL_2692 [Hydrogenibacillus schlegelii]|uniref:Uncharacterized protein n=1 Tax=Hydrogenibacillus schlegelii TaxID=1484 RepID=A0A2T5G9E8_HYDSH|nr:MAG: hypothetical protein HSCHL_2692 [Hydrogenibacillus schlegelii]